VLRKYTTASVKLAKKILKVIEYIRNF